MRSSGRWEDFLMTRAKHLGVGDRGPLGHSVGGGVRGCPAPDRYVPHSSGSRASRLRHPAVPPGAVRHPRAGPRSPAEEWLSLDLDFKKSFLNVYFI